MKARLLDDGIGRYLRISPRDSEDVERHEVSRPKEDGCQKPLCEARGFRAKNGKQSPHGLNLNRAAIVFGIEPVVSGATAYRVVRAQTSSSRFRLPRGIDR